MKIIGENTPMYSQGYFVYDSRKAGSITTSHVRFSPRPIKGSYLVHKANFVACHKFEFTERIDMLSMALPGATFLLNSPYGPDEVWDHLPCEMQKQIVDKKLKFYVVDAYKVAREAELGVRINTVMQTCFFKLANVIPPEEAIAEIKAQVKAVYGKKGGGAIVERNNAAIDAALAGLHEVKVPAAVSSKFHVVPPVPDHAPAFVKDVLGMMIANRGDDLPVSAMPVDGTFPTGTTQYEKRSIAEEIPIWDPKICIQCGLCSLGCPHASIRMKVFEPSLLEKAPAGFKATDYKAKEYPGWKFVHPGRARRLHRLRPVRRCLPRQGQDAGQAQGDRHGAEDPAPGARAGRLGLLPHDPRRRSDQGQARHGQGLAVPAAAVRVLRGLRRLRRDALHQAHHAVVRRPHVDRQRHRLLVDLRRQPALHALLADARGQGSGMVELAVRGLCRVRHGLPPGDRPADASIATPCWPN